MAWLNMLTEESKRKPLLACLVLVIISFLVYLNTMTGEFVWDDKGLIVSNLSIRSVSNIPRFFGSDSWRMTGQPSGPYYRPVINTLWTLEFQLWGENPIGYHLTNIFLNALLSLLLYKMFRNISGSETVAFLSSLIFVTHPIHVENVAWITGAGYLACTVFIVISFLYYMRFAENGSIASMLLSVIFYTFAVFSIEYALMFPVVIILYEFLIKERRIAMTHLIPFILVPLFYLVVRSAIITAHADAGMPIYNRFLTSLVILSRYTAAFFFPLKLNVLYDVKPVAVLLSKEVILSVALLTGISVLMLYLYKKDKKALFALLWFFIFLVPVLNIVVVLKPQMMSLRYLYIPSIGLAVFTGIIIEKIFRRPQIIMIILVTLLSVRTLTQNKYWHNEISLYGKMASDAPRSAIARNNLGVAYLEAGLPLKAVPEFEKAVQLDPTYGFAFFNLGNTYQALDMFDKAAFYLQKSAEINPSDSRSYNSLGVLYKKMGLYQESINQFRLALAVSPRNYEAHYNLANLLFSMGRERDAVQHYIAFLRLAPAKYNHMKISIERMLEEKGFLGH